MIKVIIKNCKLVIKHMKIKTLLFGFLLGFTNLVSGQLYIVSPNDTVETIVPQDQLSIVDIYQRNISGDTIQLAWTKVYESIPAGWDYSLCDFGTCYPGFPAGGTMALVLPPDSGFLGVNVDPYALAGTLTVRFYVYETSAPTQGDTLTWIISAQSTGIEDIATVNLELYPNPAIDYIQVNTTNMEFPVKATIYDIKGKVMLTTNIIQQNEILDVLSLPAGTYIIEVQNKSIIRRSFIKQ
jgi:hypothetical protein